MPKTSLVSICEEQKCEGGAFNARYRRSNFWNYSHAQKLRQDNTNRSLFFFFACFWHCSSFFSLVHTKLLIYGLLHGAGRRERERGKKKVHKDDQSNTEIRHVVNKRGGGGDISHIADMRWRIFPLIALRIFLDPPPPSNRGMLVTIFAAGISKISEQGLDTLRRPSEISPARAQRSELIERVYFFALTLRTKRNQYLINRMITLERKNQWRELRKKEDNPATLYIDNKKNEAISTYESLMLLENNNENGNHEEMHSGVSTTPLPPTTTTDVGFSVCNQRKKNKRKGVEFSCG